MTTHRIKVSIKDGTRSKIVSDLLTIAVLAMQECGREGGGSGGLNVPESPYNELSFEIFAGNLVVHRVQFIVLYQIPFGY